ncbi:hypothetical protein ABMA27_010907 [Loxostege sticticalis]|uniref:Uncharacterized protein n=1 Tax=Loxostege sticticalis TaxID=481309 RepID=A0ABR3H2M1_LOXSC
MVSKLLFFCASALLVQAAFGQYIAPGSYVTGNSVVDNDIYIGGGYGASLASGSGYASGAGFASGAGYASGFGLVGGSGLASGVGLAGAGLASGYGLGASSIGISVKCGFISIGVGSGVVVGGANGVAISPLLVTSISPIGPSGLAVASENVIEGVLTVTGQLPFLSAVAFEGALPTAGSGVATCGCGNGEVGIVSEGFGRPILY